MIKRGRDSGSNGLTVSLIPKAPRSARRIGSKRKLEDHPVCAFDLLAAVAGKLLQETENSSASSNETETKDHFVVDKDAVKLEQKNLDRMSDMDFFGRKERQISDEHASAWRTSDGSENVETDLRIGISVGTDISPKMSSKTKTACIFEGFSDDAVGFEIKQAADGEGQKREEMLHNKSIPSQIHQGISVKFVNRDDRKKYVHCCPKKRKIHVCKSQSYTGNSGVRKLLGYKHWRVSPKPRDHESRANDGARHFNYLKKTYHDQDAYLNNSPVKKRKLCDQSSDVTSDRGVSSDSVSKSDDEYANINKCSNGVRLSIKSIKVPELLVEVPVTATVGSLKTTVLDAVSSVLSGGLHVELMVRGKNIRGDNKTLAESGISHDCNMDLLSFMLQPISPQAPSPACRNDDRVLSSCDGHKPSERFPAVALGADAELCIEPSPLSSLGKKVKTDHDAAPISTNDVPEKLHESKALALFPVTTADPLAMVPMDQKSKRSELAQRRTRRPFSVCEVEALVQAVEELGTGRWRDVKMRSFENEEHRTYVDLKDKWKTLVHTAQISPQQRRGQPVPQELLNRVLAAHSYWCQNHQVKSKSKPHFLQSARID